MKDTRTFEQRMAIRLLNAQLIHVVGWGVPLKTKDDVNEYLDNARATLQEVQKFRDDFRKHMMVLFTWASMHNLHLSQGNTKLLDMINNAALGWAVYAERSWKAEIRILESWIKQNKNLFS